MDVQSLSVGCLVQLAVMLVPVIATLFFGRKSFFIIVGLFCVLFGVVYIFLPWEYMDKMLDVSGIKGYTHDHWSSDLALHQLGLVSLSCGLTLLCFHNSNDERVSKVLLSSFAQALVSEVLVFTFLHKKVSQNVPKPGKDGKMKPATGLQMPPEHFCTMYVAIGIWLLVTAVHYLRSPSSKPQVPGRYDNQLGFHRTVLAYGVFLSSIGAIIAPDLYWEMFVFMGAKTGMRFDDSITLHTQLAGVLMLPQVNIIRASADFINKEDQAKVFKLDICVCLASTGVLVYHAIGKIGWHLMTPVLVLTAIFMINNVLAVVRANKMELDVKESKKRR